MFSPVATSHKRMETLSVFFHQEPEAPRYRLHGENTTTPTREQLSGRIIPMRGAKVAASHRRTSPYNPPAKKVPQGENVIEWNSHTLDCGLQWRWISRESPL